jgi:hypothetical protein
MALYDPAIFNNYPQLVEQLVLLIEMLRLNNIYIQENPIYTAFTQSSISSVINADNSSSKSSSYYSADIQVALRQRSSLTEKITLAERVTGESSTHLSALEFPRKANYNHSSYNAPIFPSVLLNQDEPAMSIAEKRLAWLLLRIQDIQNWMTEWNFYHSLVERIDMNQFLNIPMARSKAIFEIVETLIKAGVEFDFYGEGYQPPPPVTGVITLITPTETGYVDRNYTAVNNEQVLSDYTNHLLTKIQSFPFSYPFIDTEVDVPEKFGFNLLGENGIVGSESEENFYDPAMANNVGDSYSSSLGGDGGSEPQTYEPDNGSGQEPQNTLPDC